MLRIFWLKGFILWVERLIKIQKDSENKKRSDYQVATLIIIDYQSSFIATSTTGSRFLITSKNNLTLNITINKQGLIVLFIGQLMISN